MVHFGGTVERTIGGKLISFKFNMAALSFFADIEKLTIKQVGEALMDPKFSTIANFLYAGAVTHCKQEKKVIEFTQDDVFTWLDEIGIEDAIKLFAEAMTIPEDEKNLKAPTTAGQKI